MAGDDVGTRCRPLAKHALSAASVGFWLLIPLSCMPETQMQPMPEKFQCQKNHGNVGLPDFLTEIEISRFDDA